MMARAESMIQIAAEPEGLTLHDRIRRYAERQANAPAVLAPGRDPLTYGALWRQVELTGESLSGMEIARNDRVALVLPNGPEMVVGFLGVSAAAICAPLNPDYRAQELEFYFTDLEVKALVIQAGWGDIARNVARALGIAIIDLTPVSEGEAGAFVLSGPERPVLSPLAAPGPDDVALMLHTSGTTSRPKMVPLSHINLGESAFNIGASLGLSDNDRCLDVMPLFHVHGLIGGALSSLVAGGSVMIVPRFEAETFFQSLPLDRPTWYTAVPTMHQAILSFAAKNPQELTGHALRFIRSCSSPLPPTVMERLENIFQVPVIEAYGMTEASHQIASNPLPPGKRKPGSVGVPSGTEIAIMTADDCLLEAGEAGEIVVRGKTVTRGYENNPRANEQGFVGGWFRTGDQGHLDHDGYLYITGRLKELINRGGEKISPREVDDVLLQHRSRGASGGIRSAASHPRGGCRHRYSFGSRKAREGGGYTLVRRDAGSRVQSAAPNHRRRCHSEGADRETAAIRVGDVAASEAQA